MATASSPSRTVSSAVSPKRSASMSSAGRAASRSMGSTLAASASSPSPSPQPAGVRRGGARGPPGQAEAAGQRRRRAVALPLAQEGQQRERSMDGLGLLGTDSRKLTSAFRRYNVTATLAPVVDRLFDDASLFPPAQLPMQAALAAHDRLRRDASTAPLVGPFLCPASRFPELDTCLASGLPRPPADDVPSCDWLAAALVGGAGRGLQLRAPAGLHHPFRSTERGDLRHGLVNLLAAAGAAQAGADVTTVSEVLATEEAAADASALVEHAAGAPEALMSVGTFSIDETAEGLRSRGLL